MENKNKLCLYVSYYLSRFNMVGYNNLGFAHMNEAHAEIGRLLDVNPNTVKNMRDEFDPLHNFRAGWYQKPLTASRTHVVEAMQSLDEFQIRTIALKILRNSIVDSTDLINLLDVISEESQEQENKKGTFILRGPTGRKAEEYFIAHYKQFNVPVSGELHDTRDLGTGYDFRICAGGEEHYIEIKGLADLSGGVLFTGKEWEMATKHQDRYHLVIVSGLDKNPRISIIANPQQKFEAKEQIRKVIQVNFSVTANQLSDYIDLSI
jgi:hypothetical protein